MMIKAFLIVVLIIGGHGKHKTVSEFPDMKQCLTALDSVKMVIPGGDENESGGVVYCSTRDPSVDGFMEHWE